MAKRKHEPQSQVDPDSNIPDMRRFLRKNYEGLAYYRYSLRSNAQVRVRQYEDFCTLCYFTANSLRKIKGLKSRASCFGRFMRVTRAVAINNQHVAGPG